VQHVHEDGLLDSAFELLRTCPSASASCRRAVIAARSCHTNRRPGISTIVDQTVQTVMAHSVRPQNLSPEEADALHKAQQSHKFWTQRARLLAVHKAEQDSLFKSKVGDFAEEAFAVLRKQACMRHFDDDSLQRLVRQGRVKQYGRYNTIYQEGALAQSLFLLLQGVVLCSAAVDAGPGRSVAPMTAFGLEVLSGLDRRVPMHREESAIAELPCVCLAIPRTQLCTLLHLGSLRPEARKLLRRQQYVNEQSSQPCGLA